MYYLISQFIWWLLLAFVVGLFVGYITSSSDERRGWGWLPFGAIVALAVLLATSLRFVNGVPALWLETALLFFVIYLAGCFLGGIIKQAFTRQVTSSGVPDWNSNLGEPAPPLGAAALVAGGLQEPGVKMWHEDRTVPFVSAAEPAIAASHLAPSPQAVASAPAMPQPVIAEAVMPKVEGEDMIAGSRPPGLLGPRAGVIDDLKLVRGIGKQNEGRLHALGIWHFDQIAAWTKDNALWVGSYLAFPGRIEREGWVAQAADLAAGKETEFAARVKRGDVATSRDDGSHGADNISSVNKPN